MVLKKKLIGEDAILESLISLKRAGSNAIVSYFALEVASQIK
jgi:delta-aminolevulinic acid dehydratase/porphobilinogen synthase